MPELTINVPPSTRISPITSIAPHLTCIRTETAGRLSDCELRVARLDDHVTWQTGNIRAIIAIGDLLAFKIDDAPFGGQHFLALVATFREASGPMSYRMLMGPQSDANWFDTTVARLRSVFWPDQNSQN